MFFLRCILLNKFSKGATGFDDLLLPGVTSFRTVCEDLKITESDKIWRDTLLDYKLERMPGQMRSLFVALLVHCGIGNPQKLLDEFVKDLGDDYRHNFKKRGVSGYDLANRVKIRVLRNLRYRLKRFGKSMRDFDFDEETLRVSQLADNSNRFLDSAKNFDAKEQLEKSASITINHEQKIVWDDLHKMFDRPVVSLGRNQKVVFLYALAGAGKTRLLTKLVSLGRGRKFVVIVVASSGIAAINFERGMTAHSTFIVDLMLAPNMRAKIERDDKLADLMREAHLIVWDECSMTHRWVFEAVERMLRDIRESDLPWGGCNIVFSGDFRQTTPIFARGDDNDSFRGCLPNSPLWKDIKVHRLEQNMRVLSLKDKVSPLEFERLKKFAAWQLSVGNGTCPTNSAGEVCVNHSGSSLGELIEKVYPDFEEHLDASSDAHDYFRGRAILCTKNEHVDEVNGIMTNRMADGGIVSHGINTALDIRDPANATPENLATLEMSGLPPQVLRLKIGMPIMLLRNKDPEENDCNGSRYIIEGFTTNEQVIIARSMKDGHIVSIPKFRIQPKQHKIHGYQLQRIQFPVRPAFAMTCHKSQGQTIENHCGVYIKDGIFAHGQLYVAVTRVRRPENLTFFYEEGMNAKGEVWVRNEVWLHLLDLLKPQL